MARYSLPPGSFRLAEYCATGAYRFELALLGQFGDHRPGDAFRHRGPAEHRLRRDLLARPGERLAIAGEESDAAVLDDPDRQADHPRPLDQPLQSRVERGIIDIAAIGGRNRGELQMLLRRRRRGARPAARSPLPTAERPGQQGEGAKANDILSFQLLLPRPALRCGVRAGSLNQHALARCDEPDARCDERRARWPSRAASLKSAANGRPNMQFLRTTFWVAIAVILAIVASENWRDVTLDLWGKHPGRHQDPGAADLGLPDRIPAALPDHARHAVATAAAP